MVEGGYVEWFVISIMLSNGPEMEVGDPVSKMGVISDLRSAARPMYGMESCSPLEPLMTMLPLYIGRAWALTPRGGEKVNLDVSIQARYCFITMLVKEHTLLFWTLQHSQEIHRHCPGIQHRERS